MMEVTVNQQNLEFFLLILVRISAFVMVSPFFGQNNTPVRVKLGFSIFLSYIVFLLVPLSEATPEYNTVIGYATLIVKESIVGLLIGFSAYICTTILQFTGKIIDMEIGLSMAQIFDPVTNTQVGLTGQIYTYLVFFLMIVSNMHIFLLNTIVDSFELIEIGGIRLGDSLFKTVVGFLTTYFVVGFRIVLPVFSSNLVMNCVLGIMAKVAPQMNMFSVGMQIKVLTGLIVMFATVSLLPSVANFIFSQMQQMVTCVIEGMV